MESPNRPPGIGVSLVALIGARLITTVVTAALVPVILPGVAAGREVTGRGVLAHLLAFGILALAVNTLGAAWLVQAFVRLLGARVTFARALGGLLAGELASSLLVALVLTERPSTVGLAAAGLVGLPVTIWILSSGRSPADRAGSDAGAWNYRRPPSAPSGWPGG